MTLYICHAWSPEKILKEYLARYQKKYPDITFSIKSFESGFDGNYTIEVNDIVLTNGDQPILQISRAEIGVSLATLIRETGDIHVNLDRVYSHENSHIFLEKEVDQLINDLTSQFEIISKVSYWKHTSSDSEIVLTETNLESDNDIPGNEKVKLKTDISYRSKVKLEFQLESELDLASLVKEKELIGKHYIKLSNFKLKNYRSKKNIKQTIRVNSFLKTNGDLKAKFDTQGELLHGSFSLILDKKSLSLNNVDLDLKLSGVNTDDLEIVPGLRVSGGLHVDGVWSSDDKNQGSNIKVKGQNLFIDEKTNIKGVELDITVSDLIRYEFRTHIGNLEVKATNKVSLDLSSHESTIVLSSEKNSEIDKEMWRLLLEKNYFSSQYLSQIELNDIIIDGQELSGDIIWSKDANLGGAQVLSLETQRGSLSGRRIMTKNNQNCLFELKRFPIKTLSWLAPKSWTNIEGKVSGEVICPNRDQYKIDVKSNEIKLPVFAINKPLKASDIKMRYYKDDRFSSLKAIWDRGRVEKISFKNRVYNIEGKREGRLMVLSLSKKELVYKEKNNQWEFQEVRR